MKKLILQFSLLLICSVQLIHAQTFSGLSESNYGGVSGVFINPANVADNRMKFDMVLAGADAGFFNNYIGLLKKGITSGDIFHYTGDFKGNMLEETGNDSYNKSAYFNADVVMPSFLVSLGDKAGLAFTWRTRFILNATNVTPELARLSYYGLYYPDLWNLKLSNDAAHITTMGWGEYGATFGMVAYNDGTNFIKAGGTFKVLQGLDAMYLYADNLSYNFSNDTILSLFQCDIQYGHSNNFDYQPDSLKSLKYRFVADPSFGGDLGIVYEYRPNYEKYQYDMDGETGLYRHDQNKYKFKVGLSLLDMGRVRFTRDESSKHFNADISNWDIKHFHAPSIAAIDDTLNSRFTFINDDPKFTIALPTTVVGTFDYNFGHNVFLNVSPFLSLHKKADKNQVSYIGRVSITPRFDSKWIGVSVPFSVSQFKETEVGIGLRAGPLVIGTNDLASILYKDWIRGANAYAALKISVPYGKPKDKDGDGVSNRKDKCKDVPGNLSMWGCPDKDGDGITDADDNCPDVPGKKELNGCPDRDNDGIMDSKDDCPDDKGLAQFNGCPDRDGDGIMDSKDDCPDTKGMAAFNGCPDTDGDGIKDNSDNCPTVAGPKENSGCPWGDQDKDGTLDKDDACPTVAGPTDNKGCPYADADKDGVLDNVDECPDKPGPASNNGCPVEIPHNPPPAPDVSFISPTFETAKSVLLPQSFPDLDKLVQIMKDYPEYSVQLDGYTDDRGDDAMNLTLSKNRAASVKAYLVQHGISASRISTAGYGEANPKADNNTEAGRAQNRRVEIHLKK